MPNVDKVLQAIVDDPAMPLSSLSALAMRGGEVVYMNSFGRRFIHPTDAAQSKPATNNTLYRVASISKLMTTLGAMRLMEEKKFDLDRDISDYLGFEVRNPHFKDRAITSRMLMCHTSSMRDDGGYFWPQKQGFTMQDVLGREGKWWSDKRPPGEYFFYANLPWGVLGTVMERVSQTRFDLLMSKLILEPMRLEGGYSPASFSAEQLGRVATLYRKRTETKGKEVWNPRGEWVAQVDDFSKQLPTSRADENYVVGSNGTLMGPQGGCRLTIEGLGRVMKMIWQRGKLDGRQIVCEACIDQMLQRQWTSNTVVGGANDNGIDNGNDGGEFEPDGTRAMNAWGLGNQQFLDITGDGIGDRLVEKGGYTPIGHLGDAYGLTSIISIDPKTGDGLAFCVGGVGNDPATNRGKYSAMRRYEERILTALGEASK
jgi:CubicO group peptidase (beta-lactamase class C family)